MQDDSETLSIRMDGRVAVVTGGGAGLGRGIAEAFARLGAQVGVIERDSTKAAATRESLAELGSTAPVVVGDVTDEAAIHDFAAAVREQHDRVDVLVNNVGDVLMPASGQPRWPFAESTPKDWDALYEVNLRQLFLVSRALIPLMQPAKSGSIINISTIEAFRGIPNHAVYSAFKAAIHGFTRSLALELGPLNIRVNTIAPETTETEQVRISEWLPPENQPLLPLWFPLARIGQVRDTAGCAVFLATELSGWVTGTTIHLDGGAMAAGAWVRTLEGRWTHRPIIAGVGYGAGGEIPS